MPKKRRRNGTKTRKFGVSKRESHDSTLFYSQNIYKGLKNQKKIKYIEKPVPKKILDKIHFLDSRNMDIIPDSSIHLMVTSPPYVAAKEYDEDLTLEEYRQLLKDVFTETYKKLVSGGRACINIANIGRSPYIPLHAFIIQDMIDIGYFMRGEIIWDKDASAGTSTAWGSWRSAKNPTLRDVHEYILIFSKETFGRQNNDRENTITSNEFVQFSKSVWKFPTEKAKKVGHPAPFPIELPYRLIQFYTFKGDVVLDPFCGSGTTAIAALRSDRHFICLDNKEEYVKKSKKRINGFIEEMKTKQNRLDEYHSSQ